MAHVPNISFREALSLGARGTLGVYDPASPDNPFVPLRSPGTTDRCTILDAARPLPLGFYSSSEEPGVILADGLGDAQWWQATQTYALPPSQVRPPRLTQQDFVDAAATLKCEVAAIKAVAEVESRGAGFLPDGRPKILFEAHQFSRLTGRVWDKLYPNISSPKWKRELYLGGAKEYERLEQAIELDAPAAIQAASWGAFQIMGFNFQMAGFARPEDFVASMYTSEGAHLKAFVTFVHNLGLAKLIQSKSWEAFAKAYNGPRYKENEYDTKLAKAYAKYAGAGTPGRR